MSESKPRLQSATLPGLDLQSPHLQGPRVFRLGQAEQVAGEAETSLTVDPDFLASELGSAVDLETAQALIEKRRRFTWGKVFRSALGFLVSLWIGVYGWQFIADLFRASETLGWVGAAVAGVALISLVMLLVREWRALARLDDLTDLRAEISAAILMDDQDKARELVRRLNKLYDSDAKSAASRAEMEVHSAAIIDGPDLLNIAERVLLKSRDAAVRDAILTASKRVSVITTLSPRAIIDVLFVGAQAVRLTRRIAEIYGGRPGVLSFLRLGRKVFTHLAITGGMAVTDGVLSQVLGHGIAARLSAKLGEGVLNGILTARVGLAAIAVCRPMPFLTEREPKLSELAGALVRMQKTQKDMPEA